MKRPMHSLYASLALAALSLAPAAASAQAQSTGGGFDLAHLGAGMLATVAYGLLGIVLVVVGYKVFSAVLPFDVKKELEEDHNLAVGVLLAALVLGICIVVAATIHS